MKDENVRMKIGKEEEIEREIIMNKTKRHNKRDRIIVLRERCNIDEQQMEKVIGTQQETKEGAKRIK